MWAKIEELRLQTQTMVSFRYANLCILTRITQKLQVVWGHITYPTTALLSELHIFWDTAAFEIRSVSYGSKHTLQSLFDNDTMYVPTLITPKLQVGYGRSTYWTIGLLSEVSIFWERTVHEIRLARYGSKHALQSLSDRPFVCTSTNNLKTTVRIWTSCISKECCIMGERKAVSLSFGSIITHSRCSHSSSSHVCW